MKLRWFGKAASSVELQELLTTTGAALTAAHVAVSAARDAVDADGSDTAISGLLRAQESEQIAQARVDSARRNLDAAVAREVEAHRAELEARADELRGQLTRAAIQARIAPLLQRQAELLEQVAACRVQLREIHDEYVSAKQTLHGTLLELGGAPEHVIKHEIGCIEGQIGVTINPVLLSELIKARVAELPQGHLRARLGELEPQVATNIRLGERW